MSSSAPRAADASAGSSAARASTTHAGLRERVGRGAGRGWGIARTVARRSLAGGTAPASRYPPHHILRTMARPEKPTLTPLASNRKALHDYEVLERLEGGLQLAGT